MKLPSAHYARPELARQFADELLGLTPLSDAPNGLFLAGDRRTGKSEFLRLDLLTELTARGVLVLYVDLLQSKQTPAAATMQVLQQAVRENAGPVAKFAMSIGLEKIAVPGIFTIDLKGLGDAHGLSVYQVLHLLRQGTGKRVALIIDEAQHALTHEEGDSLMWALKSARDQMKTTQGADLMLVMSGSHTDKLTLLLNSRRAPFWGSQVRAMPRLGNDFVDHYLAQVRSARPELATVRSSVVVQAFEQTGRRPQFLINALQRVAASASDAASFEAGLLAASRDERAGERAQFSATYLALDPLAQAVLERLIMMGKAFKPFDASALAFYAQRLGKAKVTAASAQKALDALREHDDQLVWRSLRGEYSVYDQAVIEWHAHLVAEKAWPPTGNNPEHAAQTQKQADSGR